MEYSNLLFSLHAPRGETSIELAHVSQMAFTHDDWNTPRHWKYRLMGGFSDPKAWESAGGFKSVTGGPFDSLDAAKTACIEHLKILAVEAQLTGRGFRWG